ncbi:hypothetical protein SteCoe_20021 [Stentor coeruleus]|uniref:Uncharacterized protein n=1 Tax=Stentor coeruleus TaxID=5963 RepID=A0A1R2BTG5_9CILI|nr:hypothetical protein SteCoe_20021 [Stentor coeruleus]
MELGKRHTRSSFTPQSSKKIKIDSSVSVMRVYYAGSFDMFNFADNLFLKQITQKFRNCYLIVGIEDECPGQIMNLQEREKALRQCPYVRQVLCPAPNVEYAFLKSFEIEYVICTPEEQYKYQGLELGEGLCIIEPEVKLSNIDLIARVVAGKEKLLWKCLKSGFSRKQLDISLLKEIQVEIANFVSVSNWPKWQFKLLRGLFNVGKYIFRETYKFIIKIEV